MLGNTRYLQVEHGSVHFCTGFVHMDNLCERMFVREEGMFAREEGHVHERMLMSEEGRGNVREGGGARLRGTTECLRGDVRKGQRNVCKG